MAATDLHRPARRVTIDKPDGGTRQLGIPNVLDRLIQTAIVLILNQIFDPDFSDSSFGYRPIRSAHGAVKQIQTIIGSKHPWCVDMDLSKFFDRVSHDRLMWRVGRKVRDKRLLKLIGRYLRAGVLIDGICHGNPAKEPWHLDANSIERVPFICAGLACVLQIGSSKDNVPRLGQVASATSPSVLFEAVAKVEDSAQATHQIGR